MSFVLSFPVPFVSSSLSLPFPASRPSASPPQSPISPTPGCFCVLFRGDWGLTPNTPMVQPQGCLKTSLGEHQECPFCLQIAPTPLHKFSFWQGAKTIVKTLFWSSEGASTIVKTVFLRHSGCKTIVKTVCYEQAGNKWKKKWFGIPARANKSRSGPHGTHAGALRPLRTPAPAHNLMRLSFGQASQAPRLPTKMKCAAFQKARSRKKRFETYVFYHQNVSALARRAGESAATSQKCCKNHHILRAGNPERTGQGG